VQKVAKDPPGGVRCYRYHHDADAKEQTYFVTLRCVAGRYSDGWDWAAYAA
jgi:hypothetical protein